jgi:hypothetical protein
MQIASVAGMCRGRPLLFMQQKTAAVPLLPRAFFAVPHEHVKLHDLET